MAIPGLALSALVASAGLLTSDWIGKSLFGFEKSPVSGIMMAILIGLLLANVVRLPAWLKTGIRFSSSSVLRLGIVLLGIRLSLGEILKVGIVGIPLIVLCLTGAVVVTRWIGAQLRLPGRLGILIAIGTSICGVSAIAAAGPAIRARDEEIAYAVANITVFGIAATFLYPYLAHTLFAGAETPVGLFLGTAIHDTAQVAGSGLIYAQVFGAERVLDIATVTKLVRNLFMIVIIPLMVYLYQQEQVKEEDRHTVKLWELFPVFILGFVLLAAFRTIGDATLPSGQAWGLWQAEGWVQLTDSVRSAAELTLAIAMAGVGLGTNLQQLRRLGLKPFAVGLSAAVTVGLLSLSGITLLMRTGLIR